MKLLPLICALSILAGCSGWTGSAKPVATAISLPEASAELTDCPRPVLIASEIGAGPVGEKKMLDLWARDRATAVRCRNRLLALSGFYEAVRAEAALVRPE